MTAISMRVSLLVLLGGTSAAQPIHFLRDFAERGTIAAIAPDSTGVYVAGATPGLLLSEVGTYLARYDRTGTELWVRSVPRETGRTLALGLVADESGVAVVGHTQGPLPGQTTAGARDCFLRKYDQSGKELWTRQFGTPTDDECSSPAMDAGGITISGYGIGSTSFLIRFDLNGAELWRRESSSLFGAIAANRTGIFVPYPRTSGVSINVVRKYDAAGNVQWEWNESPPRPLNVLAADDGGVFVRSNRGTHRLDNAGNLLWTIQQAGGWGAGADNSGFFEVSVVTKAAPGNCQIGDWDNLIRKYDSAGKLVWTRQFGTARRDYPIQLAVSSSGIYLAFSAGRHVLARLGREPEAPDASKPRILNECVVNAASFQGGGVAPGEVVTILGTGLGPQTPSSYGLNAEGRLTANLSETRVLFNGVASPMLYASTSQTTAIVPYGLPAADEVAVQVEYKGVLSTAVRVPRLDARPGIFTSDASGEGQALAFNQDWTRNSPANPARPGSVVTFFITGEGPTTPPSTDGEIRTGVPPQPEIPIRVGFRILDFANFDYLDGEVLYAAGIAGSVAGIAQVNVRVPPRYRELGMDGVIQVLSRRGLLTPEVTIAVQE
jgi:uncharacterized protein (TIGR03437 family)